jgi:hypothetical protein
MQPNAALKTLADGQMFLAGDRLFFGISSLSRACDVFRGNHFDARGRRKVKSGVGNRDVFLDVREGEFGG